MIDFWVETVSPGMSHLAAQMIAECGATLLPATPVAAVAQDAAGVTVKTAAGQALRARAAILALGVNQLAAVRFTPPLPPAKAAAVTTGHGGRAVKIWAKLRGVPVGTLVTGDGNGIEWAFADRTSADGATLVVGFGIAGDTMRPGDPEWVRAQFGRLFPNAQMLIHDWHDWVDDPWARGTWVSAFAGSEAGLDPANWGMEGRLAFASSDIARDQAGWFEGAVVSGEDAAAAVQSALEAATSA
jgi:monoamine oxidase